MTRTGLLSLGILCFVLAGCGSSSRQLQSISITSASANTQVPANGQVQFVATGHYNRAPSTLSPLPALWVIYPPKGAAGASITQTGLAQCVTGAASSFSVLAYAPADPSIPISELTKAKKVVLGTGQLSCA
jgi:hypothetical protein